MSQEEVEKKYLLQLSIPKENEVFNTLEEELNQQQQCSKKKDI